ncbi:MAG: HAD family hydrolase [Pirellulaceae bacterium]
MDIERKKKPGVSRRTIAAVAFDLDGLMFNTEDIYDDVLHEMLLRRGHSFTRDLKIRMMGLPGPQAARVMIEAHGLDETPAALLDEAHRLLAGALPGRLQPMPGLLELLAHIESTGLPKSVATSSSPIFARTALELCQLAERFDFVLTAEDVEQGKPHPDIYIESARRHGIETANLLVLEDSLTGSRAAAAAGTIAVAVPGHHSADQDFAHVDYCVESLADAGLRQMIAAGQTQ